MTSPPRIPAHACRRLLLSAQGLCDDPSAPPSLEHLEALIVRLGFVQVDSINVVARAQHLTLSTRLDGYRPEMLTALTENRRALFEHWTHDASLVPTRFFRWWRHRFERYATHVRRSAWWRAQLGPDPEPVIAHVEQRVRDEGPLRALDFEAPEGRPSGKWWAWKPQKAALEYLWRRGRLAVHSRPAFQKAYDLTERVLPKAVKQPHVPYEAYVDWACGEALERLGVATPAEIAAYWNAVDLAEARAWCERAAEAGIAVRVLAEDVDGRPRPAFAVADWGARLEAAPDPPARMRLLCPFDPLIRDRKRVERLFGFAYRFEAFVPPPDRIYGYYVFPILLHDQLIGRADLKLHRERGALEVRGLWWEKGVRADAARKRSLREALERMANFLEASDVETPTTRSGRRQR